MTYFWPLMENTIGNKEKTALVEFIRKSDRFTNGEEVLDFEKKWSDWQGCKHSLFVNSGSSANMLLLWAMKTKYFQDKEMVVLTPACTWATNISSMIQLGIDFVVADNDLFNFGISEKALIEAKKISKKENKDINVILITHLLGSPSDINLIKKHADIIFVMDDGTLVEHWDPAQVPNHPATKQLLKDSAEINAHFNALPKKGGPLKAFIGRKYTDIQFKKSD